MLKHVGAIKKEQYNKLSNKCAFVCSMFCVTPVLMAVKPLLFHETVYQDVIFQLSTWHGSQSLWPRVLRRRTSVARLLILWVRIPPGAWMFVCCEVLCVVR